MNQRTQRRDFLKTTAALGVGFWAAGGVSPRPSRAANEQLAFGCIGVGGKGASDTMEMARHGDIAAICDIDETPLNKAARRYPQAKKFFDWRKMLDEMGKSLNAVTVSTPDHSHGVATAAALRLGIACYTQKPMTHSVWEARRLGELAAEYKVATQMGNQYTAHENLRKASAAIRAGVLGTVKEVHIWTNRPIWPQGIERPTETPACPATIHWDLFIGPAPSRPYSPVYHPFKWRGWWDFGTGALGDMACHTVNTPYAALDLKDPVAIQATTSGHNRETFPSWSVIKYEYPANGDRPALDMFWYDGSKLPPESVQEQVTTAGHKIIPSGAIFVGEKGLLYAAGDYAEKGLNYIGVDEPTDIPWKRSPGHAQEFINAIKGGEPAMSNFPGYASGLTETILLGNLAVWVADKGEGKRVEWDAKKLESPNSPEVAEIIKPTLQNGYSL